MPIYCTGAVYIYVGIGGGKTAPLFLGTCESMPDKSTDRKFKPVMNDLTSQTPMDYIYAGGEEATISIVLTRWDELVATALENQPNAGRPNALGLTAPNGSLNEAGIGSVMGQEEFAFPVWLRYQFGGLSPARPTMVGMETGRRYANCILFGPDRDETGSKERKKHYIFKAFKKIVSFTAQGPLYCLWDSNMGGLPVPTF